MRADRILFQIYRERTYGDRYRVVYFTELGEHDRDREINRALAGDPFHDGFIDGWRKRRAKTVIERFLERLNAGEALGPGDLEAALAASAPPATACPPPSGRGDGPRRATR